MSAPASSTGPNVRILTKGGVWKNTEDEILKASVMKYGKNQWARISSLLVRKTPKQCKARWYEWLDPSIKKTEWSIQEDEKLLHLAKLMPTQWRTIAPIVGRTPAQCLERYQRLLDEAEAKDGPDDEEALTAEDVRKLRPGEIDPDPETKPARPDPVDMDEDEKEMLSEARARLANTQGKKAKRKARAKQLEDSRRLAVLQKKRELKAAGITMNVSQRRKKQVGMNYNIDIPFHAKAPVGFWNTLDEKEREIGIKTQLEATLLEKLDGKKRSATEFEDRKKDAKRIKQQKNDGAYVSAQALKAALLVENQTSNRKRLVLPAPQISDSDLQEISKMGRVGEKAKQVLDKNGDLSSSTLLNDYSTLNQSSELRTPRIESGEASVKTQARNLYAMMSAQTPLLGGEVDIEGDGGFTGATPKQSISQTPNPMAGQFTPRANGDVVIGQNGRPATVGKTPLRDQMGINTPRTSGTFDDTPRAAGSIVHNTQASLSTLFSTLPKPNNDFEIELDPENTASIVPTDFTEDAQDVQERNERQKVVRLEKELSERSAAVKMNLPRPHIIRSGAFAIDGKDQVETLLRQEMLLMLGRDAYECPDIGQVPATSAVEYECISADRMESAHALIRAEVERTGTPWSIEEFFKHRETHLDKVIYVASGRSSAGRLRLVSKLGCEEHVAIIKSKIDANRDTMRAEATTCTLLERDLATLLNPYQRQAHDLNRKFNRGWHELVKLERDFAGFKYLKESVEDAGMIDRLQAGQLELDRLMRAEEEVQQRYKELTT